MNGGKQSLLKYICHGIRALVDIPLFMLLKPIMRLMPRNRRKIIFGAWCGRQFSDNPKYFMLYLLSLDKGFKCYWVGNESIRSKVESYPGTHFVRKGSLMVLWHLLTAKWACFNLGMDCDISMIPTFGCITLLSFWHGTAFKGALHQDYAPPIFDFRGKNLSERIRLLRAKLLYEGLTRTCMASLSSPRMIEIMPFEAPWMFAVERSISAGTPKIEFLIRNAKNDTLKRQLKDRYASLFGIPSNLRWYLYMPTWRNGLDIKYSFSNSPFLSDFQAILRDQNAVLIEKQHPQVIAALNIEKRRLDNVYVVPNVSMPEIDTQELLLCADRLISDYSSCLFDFELMNRPVIHFAYDYEDFKRNDRGVEYDLGEIAAGPVVKNEQELLSAIKMTDAEITASKGLKWRVPVEGECGNSCETFARWVGLI